MYATEPDVYDPSDDTWLLIDALDVGNGERFCDVGCGAGVVGIAAARQGARVTALDRNPAALRLTAANARRNQVSLGILRSDLVAAVRTDRFHCVAFNAPYLPTSGAERLPGEINRAFDGGPTGRDVTIRFVWQLARASPERALIMASSLQDTHALETAFRDLGFGYSVRRRKSLSHETLLVYDLFASQK